MEQNPPTFQNSPNSCQYQDSTAFYLSKIGIFHPLRPIDMMVGRNTTVSIANESADKVIMYRGPRAGLSYRLIMNQATSKKTSIDSEKGIENVCNNNIVGAGSRLGELKAYNSEARRIDARMTTIHIAEHRSAQTAIHLWGCDRNIIALVFLQSVCTERSS